MKNTTKTKPSKTEAKQIVKILEKEIEGKHDPFMEKIVEAESKLISFILDQDISSMKTNLVSMINILEDEYDNSDVCKELTIIKKFLGRLISYEIECLEAWNLHMKENEEVHSTELN